MPRGSFSAAPREQVRQLDHARRSRGVVVGARMHLADLRRRQRVLVAVAEMVVVRADDDVFVGLARQIAEDVVNRGLLALDIHVERDLSESGNANDCGAAGSR